MGADLYWKITPKPQEEIHHFINYQTWHILAELLDIPASEMDEYILTDNHTQKLEALRIGATLGSAEAADDIQKLINAIDKYDSITLNIRY